MVKYLIYINKDGTSQQCRSYYNKFLEAKWTFFFKGETRCSGQLSISCPTCSIHHCLTSDSLTTYILMKPLHDFDLQIQQGDPEIEFIFSHHVFSFNQLITVTHQKTPSCNKNSNECFHIQILRNSTLKSSGQNACL